MNDNARSAYRGTGLIGHLVDAVLAKRPDTIVTSLTRRQSSGSDHVIDFERRCTTPDATLRTVVPSGADVAISCLGTTIRAAGSQAAMFRVDILRPGMLLGYRAQARPMEAIGQRLATVLASFMVGRLSGYGGIDAKTVAKAIAGLVGQTADGCRTYDDADLRCIASQSASP